MRFESSDPHTCVRSFRCANGRFWCAPSSTLWRCVVTRERRMRPSVTALSHCSFGNARARMKQMT